MATVYVVTEVNADSTLYKVEVFANELDAYKFACKKLSEDRVHFYLVVPKEVR